MKLTEPMGPVPGKGSLIWLLITRRLSVHQPDQVSVVDSESQHTLLLPSDMDIGFG